MLLLDLGLGSKVNDEFFPSEFKGDIGSKSFFPLSLLNKR